MKRLVLAFLISTAFARNVTTTFPAPAENPISQGSNWTNGSGSWGAVQTSTGLAFGVSQPTNFGDPTAVYKGAWGPSQTVTGTVSIVTGGSNIREVELRGRTTINPTSVTGYELLCNVSTGQSYGCQFVRWNGTAGDFTIIANFTGVPRVLNNDIIQMKFTGTTMQSTRNGSVMTWNRDSQCGNNSGANQTNLDLTCPNEGGAIYQNGAPGLGFYRDTGGNDSQFSQYGWSSWSANDEVPAASCSTANITTAMTAAFVGDTVTVPAGACTWSGYTIAKAITLQGAGIGQTNITLSGCTALTVTKQAAGVTRINGMSFSHPAGVESCKGIVIGGSWKAARAIVWSNDSFDTGSSTTAPMFLIGVPGGVLWSHCTFTTGWDNSMIQLKDPNDPQGSWTNADTFGMRDQASTLGGTIAGTAGELNNYIEDSTWTGGNNQGIDCDDGCRLVYRNNTAQDSSVNSHGFDTSPTGMRHYEIYNNIFHDTQGNGQNSNTNWTVWQRGGTSVIWGNQMDNIAGGFWGDKPEIKINQRVDNIPPGPPASSCAAATYPLPRQAGQNWNGTAYFTDPVYMWNNTNGTGYSGGANVAMSAPSGFFSEWANPCGLNAATFWQAGRDYVFPNPPSGGSPKPGYTAFTYPHPLASGSAVIPTPLQIVTTSLSNGLIGTAYSQTLTASGGTPAYTWTLASGTLPNGLTLSNSGVISGTPTVSNTFNFTVRVTDSALTAVTKGLSILVSGTGPPALPEGNTGIAAGFPGDVNIGTAPGVLWADNFDAYANITAAKAAYNNSYGTTALESNNVNVFTGTGKALRETVPANANDGTGNNAIGFEKTITGNRTTVFMRIYAKFPTNWSATGSEHNGAVLSGNYCGPGQGTSCDGSTVSNNTGCLAQNPPGTFTCVGKDNKFYLTTENSRDRTPDVGNPGYLNTYAYYPDQRDDFGDHWFSDGFALPNSSDQRDWGPFFVSRPSANGTLDVWTSYEIMVQLNTAGQHDGRVALWVDGVLKADWQNILVRGTPSNGNLLTIARADLDTYIKTNGAVAMNRYFDNVVIATSYIGPVLSATTFTISGTVTGVANSGVTVSLTGTSSGSTTTDGSGNYSFTGIAAGNYTVTPTKTGYAFTPASTPITITSGNGTVNFTMLPAAPTNLTLVVN